MKRTILVKIFLGISLTACSHYSGQFSTPKARGTYDKSLSEIVDLIENGEIDRLKIDQKKQKLFKLEKKDDKIFTQ